MRIDYLNDLLIELEQEECLDIDGGKPKFPAQPSGPIQPRGNPASIWGGSGDGGGC